MMNTKNAPLWAVAGLCLSIAACGGKVADQTGKEASPLSSDSSQCAPAVPGALAAPEGNRIKMHFDAIGVQIYTCTSTGWFFNGPEATLYNNGGGVAGTHYTGPTWEADDGSKVIGAKVAGAAVDPMAIPWLLLRALSHDGDGRMSDVTYVQRVQTTGGLATAACGASNLGEIARVPYTATYYFYSAEDGDGDHGAASGSCE
jgi:Protein of unknown function (DUF3455)